MNQNEIFKVNNQEPPSNQNLHFPNLSLHEAVEKGDLGLVQKMLPGFSGDVNPNKRENGVTPLELAILGNKLEIVQHLLSCGSKPDEMDPKGRTR